MQATSSILQRWKKDQLQVAGDISHAVVSGCNLQWFKKTLQSQAATCNGFKRSLQSLQKIEPSSTAGVTQCKFLCNLCCNGFARQVAGRLERVTCPIINLQRLHKVELCSNSTMIAWIVSKSLQVAALG